MSELERVREAHRAVVRVLMKPGAPEVWDHAEAEFDIACAALLRQLLNTNPVRE